MRIPEENDPPAVLARAGQLLRQLRAAAPAAAGEAVQRLADDPALREAHRQMLPPARRPGVDPVDARLVVGLVKVAEADSLPQALARLDRAEKAAVLGDARGLERLVSLAAAGGTP